MLADSGLAPFELLTFVFTLCRHRNRDLHHGLLRLFGGALDGALEVGLKPTFERFETEGQNFAGVGLNLRYYLLHLRRSRWVPWIDASVALGGCRLADRPRQQ